MEAGLLILGMHRSGTSALAGTLGLLGAEAGSALVPPQRDVNPKGFWENADIVAIHERILATLGSSWHDERALPSLWWQQPELEPLRRELKHIVQRDYSHAVLWMVKDPRLCRLVPVWLEILREMHVKPHFIICLRHPLEVAMSLEHRDGIQEERACLLWLEHLVDSERWTRGHARTVVTYERLLTDWRTTARQIAVNLSIDLPIDAAGAEKVDAFLEPALRHHHHVQEGLAGGGHLSRLAGDSYRIAANQDLNRLADLLATIAAEVQQTARSVAPWAAEICALRAKYKKLEAQAAQLTAANSAYQAELTRIKATASWQITKPLRFLASLAHSPVPAKKSE